MTATEQTEALPAVHVKFRGMSLNALQEAPGLGDEQTFTVTARCVATGREARKDGEIRDVVGMEVLDVSPGEIITADRDTELPFDDDGEDEL